MLVLVRRNTALYAPALGTFRVGVVLHGVALVEFVIVYGRLPLDNFFDTLCLCAFLIALVFLLVEWRYHFSSTSVALFPLVFIMTLVSSMETPVATWPNLQ